MIDPLLPNIVTSIPGPRSQEMIDTLVKHECPAITARRSRRAMMLGMSDTDPIVWESAFGSNVKDVDGNIYVDLTSGFGVAGAGHRHPEVVAAAQSQSQVLIHAMGDAFPDPQRIRLLERLSQLTGYHRTILGSSGSDAVEAAIKTAVIATGRTRIMSFKNSYHGLAFGSLATTDYKAESFKAPFADLLGNHVQHLPYGAPINTPLNDFAAVIVEPIQGRGGIRVPPNGWLASIIRQAHNAGALVIFDEIYTGFGRTGDWFAFENPDLEGERPDLICIGKAMGGGFPISACMGTDTVMDAWGASNGEAIHTQTFLGNPLGCAMALASIRAIEQEMETLTQRIKHLHNELNDHKIPYQGRGFLLGLSVPQPLKMCQALLRRGFIALPAGINAEVLAFTPPLCVSEEQISSAVQTIATLSQL
jgi:4-aminobutyrate aminotransferase / (S)-3-amino-2-methylpropionate transaminase / 5-aminovalerate transaminase